MLSAHRFIVQGFLLVVCANIGPLAGYAADSAEAPSAKLPPLVRSVKSGAWSAAETWEGGKLPGPGMRVQIRTGHTVIYDRKSEQVVRSIHVAGTLRFADDRDTRLCVGLIKIQAGDNASEDGFECHAHMTMPKAGEPRPALEVGAPNAPLNAKFTALIQLVYIDGMDKESCPAIVCCGGRMDFHGAPMNRTWVKLGAPLKKGDKTVTLAEPVNGWRVGDRIIVTTSRAMSPGLDRVHRSGLGTASEKIITAIEGEGSKLTLDVGMEEDHLFDREFRPEVANLSRNVIVESADPKKARGHTMYHRHSAGAISYAEFRGLGMEGVLGRYAVHFHLCGDTMRGSYVIGASIWDSANRWVTIHGTNYLVVRDCVGYLSKGHGFFMEDGTEVYNVLDRNLAVQATRAKPLPKQVLPFDKNDGGGFWWGNCLNTFSRNVAVGNYAYAYRFEMSKKKGFDPNLSIQQPDGSFRRVDVRTVPFVRFEDNQSHHNRISGVSIGEESDRVGPDHRHPLVVRNLTLWGEYYSFRPQSPSMIVENLRIHHVTYSVYYPNYDHHVYRNFHISQFGNFALRRSNDAQGSPFSKKDHYFSSQYGPLTVDGLTLDRVGKYNPDPKVRPMIGLSDYNPTGAGVTHLRNVKVIHDGPTKHRTMIDRGPWPYPPNHELDKGVPIYIHDYYGPGRHAKIVSTAAVGFGEDGLKYREESPLTGHQSRVAEVANVEFPKLLDPVDDLPPATVITHVLRQQDGRVLVRGTTSDNGAVTKVLVNGKNARAVGANYAEWEVVLPANDGGNLTLRAHAEDAAGNLEPRPHVVTVTASRHGS